MILLCHSKTFAVDFWQPQQLAISANTTQHSPALKVVVRQKSESVLRWAFRIANE
jgi:hypothetical protein